MQSRSMTHKPVPSRNTTSQRYLTTMDRSRDMDRSPWSVLNSRPFWGDSNLSSITYWILECLVTSAQYINYVQVQNEYNCSNSEYSVCNCIASSNWRRTWPLKKWWNLRCNYRPKCQNWKSCTHFELEHSLYILHSWQHILIMYML